MDLDWIFYGFHGSEVDFPWNSWISGGFPWIRIGFSPDAWIWDGFSTEFMDLEWISMDLEYMEFCLRPNGALKHRMDFLRIS